MLQNETIEDGNFRPRMFLGANLPEFYIKQLEELGFDVRRLMPSTELDAPVSTHPDMLICQVGDKFFVPEKYYLENKTVFDGVCVTAVDADMSPKYPKDVIMNALIMGDTLYGRTDVICSDILQSVKKHVYIRQGYSACSTLVISENAAVTADVSIAKALLKNGVDVCRITPGHILLKGYNCGFIGGASVRVSSGSIAFFGDLSAHPDHEKICKFAEKYNTSLISLSGLPLEDFGGGKCVFYD